VVKKVLLSLSWFYMALLLAWLAGYIVIGDRLRYLGLINLLAVYLFIPLPVLLLAAIFFKRASLGVGFSIGLMAFLFLWGLQFNPLRLRGVRETRSDSSLSIMTYNVLAWHSYTGPILEIVRHESPDVVFIQELNNNLARTLQTELIADYPYQILEPINNPRGIGVISRYPIHETGVQLHGAWIGGPQVLSLDWNDMQITLVNIHMTSTTGIRSRAHIERTFAQREDQARLLAEFVQGRGPTILAGDANAAPQNDSYRILASELIDAWRVAGFGLGHTFPGSTIPGSDRPRLGNWYVPAWLSRIDYIFHSSHFRAVEARTARVDGISDHRGVVAVLVVR
jgi:vancomycin resistance protein VanJ